MEKYNFNMSIPCDINKHNAKSICNKLSNFNSDIYISKNDDFRRYSAKSRLGLISLDINKSDNVNIEVYGFEDEFENIESAFNLPIS